MSDSQDKSRSSADDDLQREIRKERKFTLEEAIGRLVGPGAMKGAPPTTRTRQAEAQIQDFLRYNLSGTPGCVPIVLLRQVMASELLFSNLDQPLVVLASHIQSALRSECQMKELVRLADVEWGQMYGEQPHFQQDGCPPDADDPYTLESVRDILQRLLDKLNASG